PATSSTSMAARPADGVGGRLVDTLDSMGNCPYNLFMTIRGRDKAHPFQEPEVCSCAALRQAARRVTRLYDDALAPTGLGVNQFSILARLSHVGASTIQDLARPLVMDRSTLGHLLRPLEKRGLVRLDVSDEDGRSRL